MHLVVVRRSILERRPELAGALFSAFCGAKRLALRDLELENAPKTMLPWAPGHLAETRRVLGADFWSYGLAANRKVVEAQIGFSRAQHLISRDVKAEELFAASSLELADA
jgi:4,5-dihydroxyphthalate decarboxylase